MGINNSITLEKMVIAVAVADRKNSCRSAFSCSTALTRESGGAGGFSSVCDAESEK